MKTNRLSALIIAGIVVLAGCQPVRSADEFSTTVEDRGVWILQTVRSNQSGELVTTYLDTPAGRHALAFGVEFKEGQMWLGSVTNGEIGGCTLSSRAYSFKNEKLAASGAPVLAPGSDCLAPALEDLNAALDGAPKVVSLGPDTIALVGSSGLMAVFNQPRATN